MKELIEFVIDDRSFIYISIKNMTGLSFNKENYILKLYKKI